LTGNPASSTEGKGQWGLPGLNSGLFNGRKNIHLTKEKETYLATLYGKAPDAVFVA
jgi:hypothetical protein